MGHRNTYALTTRDGIKYSSCIVAESNFDFDHVSRLHFYGECGVNRGDPYRSQDPRIIHSTLSSSSTSIPFDLPLPLFRYPFSRFNLYTYSHSSTSIQHQSYHPVNRPFVHTCPRPASIHSFLHRSGFTLSRDPLSLSTPTRVRFSLSRQPLSI